MGSLDEVFKAYDVRGTVPDQLDEQVCRAIGAAFAAFAARAATARGPAGRPGRQAGDATDEPAVRGVRLLVARDMRASGVSLSRAFMAGALAAGAEVCDLGLASTDLLYFASGVLDAPGAMFTASHNPAGYNGIKFCLSEARPVGQDTGLGEIKQAAAAILAQEAGEPPGAAAGGDDAEIEAARKGGALTDGDMLDDYARHVRSFVELGALRPLKVVADTANGMGGLVVPKVFEGLPFALTMLFAELDGTFPNHPADPIQEKNLADLKEAVLREHADVGLAFDGDADRVFLVDEKANPVSGSLTTALVAAAMIEKHPGATVLHNLICSKIVPETIVAHGGRAVRTRVGHSFIKEMMAETGAVFGGEHSGHYYFRDNYRADSGLIAAAVVLEVMSKAGVPLSELLAPYRRYAASGEVNTEVADPGAVIEGLRARFERPESAVKVDLLDGLSLDGGSWWCNIRPSNTEPLLRCNVEADTAQECEAKTAELLELVFSVDDEVRKARSGSEGAPGSDEAR